VSPGRSGIRDKFGYFAFFKFERLLRSSVFMKMRFCDFDLLLGLTETE